MTTKIEWCDEAWNPVVGCSKISAGCLNCYAAAAAISPRLQQFKQYQSVKNWDGTINFVESALAKPLKWLKPKKVFVCSMSDLFHENIPDEWRDYIFAVMAICDQHTFQVLTKRPENAVRYFEKNPWRRVAQLVEAIADSPCIGHLVDEIEEMTECDYLKNTWIGVTAENQAMADKRIPLMRKVPAAVRWLSIEPLLEAIDLRLGESNIRWVVVGGESGQGYRQMDIAWLNSAVEQCIKADVPVFVKQDSSYRSGQQKRIPEQIWSFKQFPSQFMTNN